MDGLRALPTPQTWRRQGQAREASVSGRAGLPGGCRPDQRLGPAVLVWCPQLGCSLVPGRSRDLWRRQGGGGAFSGLWAPWAGAAPSGSTLKALPALPEPLPPPTWPTPVPQRLDVRAHLSTDSAPPQPSRSGPHMPLECLRTLPGLARPPPCPPRQHLPQSLIPPGLSFLPAPPPRTSHLDQVRAISQTRKSQPKRRWLRSEPEPVKAEAASSSGHAMEVCVLSHLSLQVTFQGEVLPLQHADSRQDRFPQR